MSALSTHLILMIRPYQFGFNPETAESNAFQQQDDQSGAKDIASRAQQEFDQMVARLTEAGVQVLVVEDTPSPLKPDAVFPNNWITLHDDGKIITYPMQANARRQEVREDIVDQLMSVYGFSSRLAFEKDYPDGPFLEGTGSMILDRPNRVVYACLSPRTDRQVLEEWCRQTGYRPIAFRSVDSQGKEIYHTNVMMALGNDYAVICLESIPDPKDRQLVTDTRQSTGKAIVEISLDQVNQFAGNMLQVLNKNGDPILVMSEQARQALHADQLERLEARAQVLAIPLWTIERIGGGSARCMMAEIFPPKKVQSNHS